MDEAHLPLKLLPVVDSEPPPKFRLVAVVIIISMASSSPVSAMLVGQAYLFVVPMGHMAQHIVCKRM
jgi:hypothetical protein